MRIGRNRSSGHQTQRLTLPCSLCSCMRGSPRRGEPTDVLGELFVLNLFPCERRILDPTTCV